VDSIVLYFRVLDGSDIHTSTGEDNMNPFWKFNIWFDRLPNGKRDTVFFGILAVYGLVEFFAWLLFGLQMIGMLFLCVFGIIRIMYHMRFGGHPIK
jgi:hypothetical protein